MKLWKKLTACAMSVFLAGVIALPALAEETRTKIEEVSLSFAAYDDGEDTEYGEVDVTTGSNLYAVEDVEFLSNTSSAKYPRVKVTLYAENNYYFGSSSKNTFNLDGEGAFYKSASLKNNKESLVLTVELRKYSGAEADIAEDVEWDYEGKGTWSEVPNAGYYEVRLKRGTAVVGDIIKVEDTFIDFSNMITQTGNYSFQVRTINRYITSNKSKWASSERWSVDEDTLQELRQNSGNSSNNYYNTNNSNTNTSNGTIPNPGTTAGWRQDNIGYWYQNANGTYPAACWQYIDGNWYYFNPSGYMVASNWQQVDGYWYFLNALGHRVDNQWLNTADGKFYYVGADGRMLTNTRTPDGYFVDANGVWQPGM